LKYDIPSSYDNLYKKVSSKLLASVIESYFRDADFVQFLSTHIPASIRLDELYM